MSRLGDHLRKLRKTQGFSLDDLASKTEISRSYLWKLERKPDVNPSLDLLQKLADALGTTVGDLAVDSDAGEAPAVPASLLECQEAYGLTPADLVDLARIRFRGDHPTDKDDWYALFLQLKRAVGSRGERGGPACRMTSRRSQEDVHRGRGPD
jgi:transcriptional regulator with XRE-family HTH domain